MMQYGPGIRILVVDDDVSTCSMVCQILDYDYTTRAVHTCAEALELARAWHPTLAVINCTLPDGTGVSLLSQLYEFNPQLRVLCISPDLKNITGDPQYDPSKVHAMLKNPFSSAQVKIQVRAVLAAS